MSIGLKTNKMLWGRAAGRCSMPGCRIRLYEDETDTDDAALIGEICHIIAESDDGPRGDPSSSAASRDVYGNLLLLCRNHHRIIDAQVNTYSVQRLLEIKEEHEAWVRAQLDFDPAKQRDDEYYAGLVEDWERQAHVNDWLAWSSSILSHGQPSMPSEVDEDLFRLRRWLLGRVWPERYPMVELAFRVFALVLGDFQETFRSHAEGRSKKSEWLVTRKFYKIDRWDEELYHDLLRKYDFHVDLVDDLMLELTRAGNLLCDSVRRELLPHYRLREGHLLVQSGPNETLGFTEMLVRYSREEAEANFPYPGLPAFLDARAGRDRHFGSGASP